MRRKVESFLQYLHDLSSEHRHLLAQVNSYASLGCFCCKNKFNYLDIKTWLDEKDGQTAFCPKCGIDSVIPLYPHHIEIYDNIKTYEALLDAMEEYWFQTTYSMETTEEELESLYQTRVRNKELNGKILRQAAVIKKLQQARIDLKKMLESK